jgi:hypothetical protein
MAGRANTQREETSLATQTGNIQPFNFSKSATAPKVVPDGNAVLIFVKHDMKNVQSGKNTGAPMVVAQFKPDAEFHPKWKNSTLFRNIPLIAPDEDAGERGTYWVMNQVLEGLGLGEDELVAFNLDSLPSYYGRKVVATVSHREYEGEQRNEVNKFRLHTGEMPDGAINGDAEEDADEDAAPAGTRSRLR